MSVKCREMEIPSHCPLTRMDVLYAWENAISEFGLHDLNYPFITYDPNIPFHFGISTEWKTIINLYHLPKNIPENELLWWIEYGIIYHELSHYHVCPYDAISIYRYLSIIDEILPDIPLDSKFGILNYFSDLIIDTWLSDHYPINYQKAQMYWYKENDYIIQEKDLEHSILWKVMVIVMEMKWETKEFQFNDLLSQKLGRKISIVLKRERPWNEKLKLITTILKDIFKKELDKGTNFPIDLALTHGDPYDRKFPSRVSKKDRTDEIDDVVDYLAHDNMIGKKLMVLLKDLGITKNVLESNRLWFRSKSKSLITYDPIVYRETIEVRDQIIQWKWGDSMSQLNFVKSLSANPLYPFPPYAKKYSYRKGGIGKEGKDYLDVCIIIDSSSSMGSLSVGNISTRFDYAVLSSFSILHASYEKRVKFKVINFSSESISTRWFDPTHENLERAERAIMRKIGKFTILPIEDIKHALSSNTQCIGVIITDGDVRNWNDIFHVLDDFKNIFYLFSIGTKKKEHRVYKSLRKKNVEIFPIVNISDLPNIVLKNVSRHWT